MNLLSQFQKQLKALGVLLFFGFMASIGQAQTIRYVKQNGTGDGSSWANASADLQGMINATGTEQVWVAKGTYKPGTSRNASFSMKAGVKIYGSFAGTETSLSERTLAVMTANQSILSGDLNGDDATAGKGENSYHVILNDNNGLTTSNSLLDGFTITGGNASEDYGGGMSNKSSSPSLSNLSFVGNESYSTGGGVDNYRSSPSLVNCSFLGNKASVGGGGMSNGGNSSPSLVNCSFLGNEAYKGGGIFNLVFCAPSLVNCSLSGNKAISSGGGISSMVGSPVSFKNCILWGNKDEFGSYNEVESDDSDSNPTYTNTLVEGLAVGGFQGTENPLFVNQPSAGLGTSGDLRLQACSPVLNAGNNADNSTIVDLGGNNRKIGTIDLGAYEYQSTPPAVVTPTVGISHPTTCGGTEGNIRLSGFLNNTTYSVTYKKNNVSVSAANFTSDGSGVLTFTGLGAGSYTDMVATLGTCVSNAATATLTDPTKPTATIAGTVAVCQNGASPSITFTGQNGTGAYTFTYKINEGTSQTVTTTSGNSVTVPVSTGIVGGFTYHLQSVSTPNNCSQSQTGSAMVTVNPLPTASISGTVTVCQNSSSPSITFTGANATAPYTFTYKINDGASQTVTTVSGNSVTVPVSTTAAGTFTYSLISVSESSSTSCSQGQTGSAVVTVNPLPTASISGTVTVCQNGASPNITFTGSNATAPYTFTYKINDGVSQTVKTVSGNSVTVPVSTTTVGTFTYTLVSVSESSSTTCSQSQTGSAVVTVNPLPTASISGTVTVCQNSASPSITFTGSNATAPYTFTYKINDGAPQTVTTVSGNSVTVPVSTTAAGTFTYALVSVSESSSTACSQSQTGSATVTVNPLPMASISGTVTVCQNAASPSITFTGANATAPYTFTYKINDGAPQTVTTVSGNSVTVPVSTNTVGTFTYTLVSVLESSSTSCSQSQTGSAVVTVNPLPMATISGITTVCQNSSSPSITFTGANATAPYTFTYKINDGAPQTVTTVSGNSVTVPVSTTTAGTFTYTLVSVSESSSTSCSQSQTGSAMVTVNPLPTASISGTVTVCQNGASPNITFTGSNATAPYTFTYKINDGVSQTVTTVSGNSVTVPVSTTTAGTFTYTLVSVTESSSTACSQVQMGSAVVTVNPLPTASISGTVTVCQNSSSPSITFTGSNATAPYTFTYKINDSPPQTVKTVSGNSVTVPVSTNTVGTFTYTLVSVSESSSTSCSQLQMGSVVVKVQGKPTITLTTLQQTLNEGNSQTFCDIDSNPVNNVQFTVTTGCVVGAPVWRVQMGSGAWSDWSPNAPVSQSSNNQPYRYQAACDASCPVTYTNPIEVKINYRASTPQQVSLVADGVTVKEGESKEVCNIEGNALVFNATCASGEIVLYSVDGGDYSGVIPTQLVDGQFHNYRVRCRKSDGTPSCIESESGAMRLKITNGLGQVPVASLNVTSGCGTPVAFSGTASCGSLTTVWYNALTNVALPTLPSQTPTETMSYYARCQAGGGCLSEKSNVVTYTVIPVGVAPVVSASSEVVCAGTTVTISANCPSGSTTSWNTGVTTPSFEVSFNNVTKQTYWAKCVFAGGCQSAESVKKEVYWSAFVVTLINVGQTKSAVKPANDKALWSSQFIGKDGGPELAQSTQSNPTLYYVENVNKVAPRYWTINVDACGLGTDGSLTFDLLATPETGVPQSFNTHENNAPYFMYANRDGWTELYAQNHPAYGFYQDNGAGGNAYDSGLPKGLYKLGIRYWDQKGWGSIYPSTRKPQGNVLAYQEYWFRIQSKDGIGVGAARVADSGQQGSDRRTVNDLPPNVFAQVMPNPVSSVLRLQVQGGKGEEVQTTLMDASGRSVLRRQFVPETNTHQEEFGVGELPTGIYFLQVVRAEKQTVLKVVKVE